MLRSAALAAVVALAGLAAEAQAHGPHGYGQGYGPGYGMMGPGMMGPGMMGGYGPGNCPMMGYGYGPGPGMGYGPGQGMGHGMMGHGMMGQGMGPGMMGPGMMGQGMGPGMGQGRGMGPGSGSSMGPGYGGGMPMFRDRDLGADEVRHVLEHQLAMHGNPRLKVGEVTEADADSIIAEIVTQDGSLVQKYSVDRHTGRFSQVE
ncbi:MAG: hypothetical protein ACFCUQ_05620 [Kiloniellales bacterium]